MADSAVFPTLASPYPTDPRYAGFALAAPPAPAAAPAALPVAPDPGFLSKLGTAVKYGAQVATPQIFGQALQAFGADETGKDIADAARARGEAPEFQNLSQWQQLVGGAIPVIPAAALHAAAAFPALTPFAAPAAAAADAGLGALFGGSQYTETREKGGSVPQALATGAIQSVGQAVGAGVAGKLLTGAGGIVRRATTQGVLDSFASPSALGSFGKALATQGASQAAVQGAAAGGVAAVEQGLPDTPDSWEAAKQGAKAGLALTALLGPFAAAGTMLNARTKAHIAGTVMQAPDPAKLTPAELQGARATRERAAMLIAREMAKVDPEGARAWQGEVQRAINADAPVPSLDANYTFDPAQPTPPPAQLPFTPLTPAAAQPAPFDESIQRRADMLYAARDAEDMRLGRDRPSAAGIDVTEIPTQDMHAPGETIDIHAPEEPSTAGYDVTELPGEEIPVHTPEHYQPQTIDIEKPLFAEGEGGPKGGRGSQPSPDEVAAQLQAAKAEPQPAQGTAAALGLLPAKSPIMTADGGGYSISKQDRVKWLRDGLGSKTPGKLLNELASLQPNELADALQQTWHEKGGEGASQMYVQRLESMYQQLTGKDVRDVTAPEPGQRDAFALRQPTAQTVERTQDLQADATRQSPPAKLSGPEVRRTQNDLFEPPRTLREIEDEDRRIITGVDQLPRDQKFEALIHNSIQRAAIRKQKEKANATTTPEEGAAASQGAEPGPAAAAPSAEAAGVDNQVHEAERTAQPGIGAGVPAQEGRGVAPAEVQQLVGAENATRTGQEPVSGVAEHQNGNRRGSAAEAGGGNRNVEGRQEQGNAQAQGQPLREEDVRSAHTAKAAELLAARRERSQLLAEINRNPKQQPTAEQFGRRQEVEQRIGRLAQEREQLGLLLDETRNPSPEPAAEDEHYQFARAPLDPEQGFARGQNLLNLTSWLQAKVFTKSGEPWYRELAAPQSIDRMNNAPKSVRSAAQRALDALTPEQHAHYKQLAEMYRGAVELNRRMGEAAKAAEARVQKAFREQIEADARARFMADQADKLLRAGRITPERAQEMLRVAARTHAAEQEKLDKMKRGIAAFDDAKLAAKVQDRPTAVNALEHIAKTHANPLMRHVARVLADHVPTATVEVVDNPDFDGARYVPATDTIEVGRGGMNSLTLMHEATHALAHRALGDALANITRDPAALNTVERRGVEALRTVRDVMDRFRDSADLSDPAQRLALDNEHEFLSEALNNPTIQLKLGGRANLWQRVKDALGKLFGVQARSQSDFERMLEAAPALFGNPLRSSTEVFRRSLLGDAMDDSPRGQLNRTYRAVENLGNAGAKLGQWFSDRDTGAKLKEEGYKWITLNHLGQMMKLKIDRAAKQFAGTNVAPALDAARGSLRSWRDAISTKQSIAQWMLREGNAVAKRLASERSRNLKWFDRMTFMGTEATRLGFDPAAKSFAEAKQRNSSLTEAQYNSPEARKLRAEYAALEAESARRLRADPKADTPIKLYHDIVTKHEADALRSYAMIARNAIDQFGLRDRYQAHHTALDIVNYRKLSTDEQIAKMRGALNAFRQQTAADAKPLADRERAGEKLSADEQNVHEFSQMADDIWGQYQYHQSVPYMHLGRVGDYLLKFTVKGGDAEWDRVGEIVGGDRTKGGLERAWGPMRGGNRDVYMRFEDETQFLKAEQRLRPLQQEGLFNDETGKSTWAAGRSADRFRGLDGASPQFVQKLKSRIDSGAYDADTKTQLKRDITDAWIAQLPETSPLKASLFRDGDVGYSKDFMNTFANRLTMSKVGIANSYASPLIANSLVTAARALQTLERTPGAGKLAVDTAAYLSELKGRVADLQTPVNSPIIDRARALTATWRLAMSPAYMMMTMYQPWQVTLPFVGAKYGMAKTATSMARNSALSFAILNQALKSGWATEKGVDFFTKASNLSDLDFKFDELKKSDGRTPLLSPEQQDLLEHLRWSGLLNFGQANQFARMDASEMGPIAKASRIASVFPHYAEISNRMTAMLTAHEMALAHGRRSGMNDEQAHEFAKNEALQAVRDTDGDHSQANVARRLGRRGVLGAATPLVVGFGQYDIQMTELLVRTAIKAWSGTSKEERVQAAKALGGLGAMTGLMAGALGLPFVGAVTGIVNGVQSLLQDDNSQPPDMQADFRNFADSTFGPQAGEIISRGLPRLLDVDMSTRSGFQDLAPFSGFLADRRKLEDKLADGALSFMGPAVGAVAGLWTGARAAYEGDYPKAINDALPAEVRNLAKAYRLSQYGYETQGGNNQIPVPATGWNVLTQALGLQSGRRAEQSERAFAFNTNNQLLQHRQEVIRNEIYRAVDHGDYERLGSLMQSMVEFSMQHPQYHADIAGGLRERATARAVGAATGTGVLTSPRMLPQLQRFSFGSSPND